MSGIRRCAKCSKLFKIQNAGPEAMRSDGSFPKHVCPTCNEPKTKEQGKEK